MIERARDQMKPVALTAEQAAKWDKAVERVLAMHPEARAYVELRREWQAIHLTIDPDKPDSMAMLRELTARAKMRVAYVDLPSPVQRLSVL